MDCTGPEKVSYLFCLVPAKKPHLFQCYVDQDGEFHGDDDTLAVADIPLTQEDLDKWSDDEENSMDREFV